MDSIKQPLNKYYNRCTSNIMPFSTIHTSAKTQGARGFGLKKVAPYKCFVKVCFGGRVGVSSMIWLFVSVLNDRINKAAPNQNEQTAFYGNHIKRDD